MLYKRTLSTEPMVEPLTIKDFKKYPEIRNARRMLLLTLMIHWVYQITLFIGETSYFNFLNEKVPTDFIINISMNTIYIIIFRIMTIKCNRKGILVLAWLILISNILILIGVVGCIILLIMNSIQSNIIHIDINSLLPIPPIFFLVEFTILSIIQIPIMIFSFRLTKFIRIVEIRRIAENLNLEKI